MEIKNQYRSKVKYAIHLKEFNTYTVFENIITSPTIQLTYGNIYTILNETHNIKAFEDNRSIKILTLENIGSD
jgi:hypothetical protein